MRELQDLGERAREIAEVLVAVGGERGGGCEGEAGVEGAGGQGAEGEVFVVVACIICSDGGGGG